jgi:predicted transcriptional regulator of viral defense system
VALLRPNAPAQRGKLDTDALAALAARQFGVVSRAQLDSAGVSDSAISRWVAARRLHRIHPGVYAIGYASLSLEARLFAALLYGGDQAVFSHTTVAWIWSLIDTEPTRIHLTVPGRRRSLPEVRVHRTREMDGVAYRGQPVTSVPRTLLDIASVLSFRQLRRALAEADYRGLLDDAGIADALGRGHRGSRALRQALSAHLPELAETLSPLEERFLEFCETAQIPLPEVNGKVSRMRIDALWRECGVAVEVDGGAGHTGLAAIKRDRQREMALRANGFQVVRYTWEQVTGQSDEVAADLRRLLGI